MLLKKLRDVAEQRLLDALNEVCPQDIDDAYCVLRYAELGLLVLCNTKTGAEYYTSSRTCTCKRFIHTAHKSNATCKHIELIRGLV